MSKRARVELKVASTVLACLLVAACGSSTKSATTSTTAPVTSSEPVNVTASTTRSGTVPTGALVLNSTRDYGNRYADGILPVGDGHYQSEKAKAGYVDACAGYATSLSSGGGGGAQARGPWFTNNNTSYDVKKKVHVEGKVMWAADFSIKVASGMRTIVTNDLPKHPTGTFPIASTDPAYAYDRNPNSIKGQTLTLALDSSPTYGTPHCMGGEVGVMLTGVMLFNGFDAGARDAGAWEVQDSCDGHPELTSLYHYHTLSSCISKVGVSTVIGWALDSFPITGPLIAKNDILTTSDLDECHGIVSPVDIEGKSVETYHYVMTEDFPYSISCFRGTPIASPGMQSAGHGPGGGPSGQAPPG